MSYLDLSEVPPGQDFGLGLEAGILLIDTLNRLDLPRPEDVPGVEQAEKLEPGRWKIPHTPITIAKVAEGPQAGEWLFAPTTIQNAREWSCNAYGPILRPNR